MPEGTPIGAWPTDGELFIGLVAPIGVDLDEVVDRLVRELKSVDYTSFTIRLTDALQHLRGSVDASPADKRYAALMDLGNAFRDEAGVKDAMATLGVGAIRAFRADAEEKAITRRAYIIRQLKRPEEVHLLRRLYGENFVLVAATQPMPERLRRLSRIIADSESRTSGPDDEERAKALVKRDELEEQANGQNVRGTFSGADIFVNPGKSQDLSQEIERLIDLLFERRVRTPRNDEYAMFQAWGAALRSGSLARQVGACIYDDKGSTLATGTNDVPKAFGGLYSEDDLTHDHRDHHQGGDPSDQRRLEMLAEVIEAFASEGWLAEGLSAQAPADLATKALRGPQPILKSSRLNAIIEFVRAAHAEQSAIADAARRGVSLAGSSLAVTTFPCHECARLILAAGVSSVKFIEPYPKSLAGDMYSDSLAVDEAAPGKVNFEPFLGVAPRLYARVFAVGADRKHPDGRPVVRTGSQCQLRLTYDGSRLDTATLEQSALAAVGHVLNLDHPVEP